MATKERATCRLDSSVGFFGLFALLYGAFGVHSPFFPSYLESRGISASDLGLVLAVGTALRLVAAPCAGFIADEFGARRLVLGAAILAAALIGFAFLVSRGPWSTILASLALALALAPVAPLADALATADDGRARRASGMAGYGLIRAAGSAAFVVGTLMAGQIVAARGVGAIVVLQMGLLAAAALLLALLSARAATAARPDTGARRSPERIDRHEILAALAQPSFQRVIVIAGLVFGSHAMHDAFAVIRWRSAGVDPGVSGLLWAEAVAAEVVVLAWLGPRILARLGPARTAALCALLGAARWVVMAVTAWIPALIVIQPLHGFTFALLHLTCLQVLKAAIPSKLMATSMTLYATLGSGVASVVLTALSGYLYAKLGAPAFALMGALCLAAVPISLKLGRT